MDNLKDKLYSTTTVKIPNKLYEDYKMINVRTKLKFQDIVHRSLYLFLTDDEFRYKIFQTYDTHYTGSAITEAIHSASSQTKNK